MKKCMAYFVVLAMLFCLMGCGSTRNENMEAAGNGNGVNGPAATETPGNGQDKQNGTNGQTADDMAGNSQGNLDGNNGQTTDGTAGNDQENHNGTNGQTTEGAAGNSQDSQNGTNGQITDEAAGNSQDNLDENNGQITDGAAGNSQDSQNGTNGQTTDGAAGNSQDGQNGTNGQTTDGVAQEPLGKALASDFKKHMKNKRQMDPMELAKQLLKNPAIEFEGTTTEVREGYLTGFRDDIDGFERGVMFAPVISSIPFVGYVFRTEDNEDAEELKWELKEEADPNWNICTEATQTVVKVVGNMVFFVMCP